MALVKFTRRPSRTAFSPYTAAAPFSTMEDLENRMNRFMERTLGDTFATTPFTEAIGWVPAMDIIENATELTLTAELPGMDQKDIDVSIEEGVLTVRGEKTEERKEGDEEKKVYLYERSYGSFQRSFALPTSVDANKIDAAFDKGVLKIHMPKMAEAKAKGRKVEIKAAAPAKA